MALATAKEAFDLAQQLDPGPVPAHAAAALAYANLETGHAERSAELLIEFAGGNELRLIGGAWRARHLELLTRSFIAAGRRDEAEHAAAAAHACAEAVGLPMAGAMASLAAAALDLDAGESSSAAERALDAAAALEEVGNVFDAASARLLAGRALVGASERERAVTELERAAAAFESFGSQRSDCRPSVSYASSDARSIGAAAQAKQTSPALPRSPSANCKSRASSSTARPTLRSQPSSS